jgi:endonuclease/exonuclease/phosphatase family metal-dependent hydrolase
MPNQIQEKMECWRSLLDLMEFENEDNFIIAGDFNTTLHHWEKRGGTIVSDSSREYLEDLISSLDLFDVNPSKGVFTWSNRRVGPRHISTRLDHFFIGSALLTDPSALSSQILPWTCSNHKPISLAFLNENNLGPIPFRFNPM